MMRRNTIIAQLIENYDPKSDAAKFFADPKNQQEICARLRDTAEFNQELREAMNVSYELFHRPTTI